MTARPTVSVALCTHNGGRFIEQQVRSILAQSELPLEVVVSDDASTDDTVERIEAAWNETSTVTPTLRIIRNKVPLGVTLNFQQAVGACQGDLIALSDQDDVWNLEKVRGMVDAFDNTPELGLLFTDARLVDGDTVDLGLTLFQALEVRNKDLADIGGGGAFSVLLRRNLVTGATVMFRRGLRDVAVPFDRSWVHDEWLAIVAAAVMRVTWLPDLLTDYRQHSDNVIGVAVPSFKYKVSRVFEPRGERYVALLERAEHLHDRLQELNVSADVMVLAEEKLRHQRMRANLRAARIARLFPVLREALTGRYARFSSRGNLDILRDLLQPSS